MRETAELAGVHFQSLSRFIGEDRADGEEQTGLDSGTLERLWSHFGLSIALMDGSGEIAWIASSGGFAEQLRETIRISGVRPVQISKATGIPKSSLSLFLKGTRPGLAFRNVEKLWSYLHLCITESSFIPFDLGDRVSPTDPGMAEPDDDLDDLNPFIY